MKLFAVSHSVLNALTTHASCRTALDWTKALGNSQPMIKRSVYEPSERSGFTVARVHAADWLMNADELLRSHGAYTTFFPARPGYPGRMRLTSA
ncbi:hypothetical protein D3C79_956640 [compost metagenome]